MYVSVTRDIRVLVEPNYLDDQSSPEDNYYAWAYRIRIENKGKEIVQLHSRYWQITDKHGRVQEVRGLGVVGEQPVLRPGEAFEYTSGAQLSTESGIMAGAYEMQGENGEMFRVVIPTFSLDSPHEIRSLQ
jgi:ApaG protein